MVTSINVCFLYIYTFFRSFEFRLRVTLGPGGELTLTSRIRNASSDRKPFKFCLSCSNLGGTLTWTFKLFKFHFIILSEVRVEGLETLDYLDNMHKRNRFTEQGDALTFESEVRLVAHFPFRHAPPYPFQHPPSPPFL